MDFQKLDEDPNFLNLPKQNKKLPFQLPKKIQTSMVLLFCLIFIIVIFVFYLFITIISKSYEISSLEGQLANLSRDFSSKTDEQQSVKLEIESLTAENSKLKDSTNSGLEEIQQLKKEYEKEQFSAEAATESYENIYSQCHDGNAKIEKLIASNEEKSKNVAAAEIDFTNYKKARDVLIEEIESLTKTYRSITGKDPEINPPKEEEYKPLVNNSKIFKTKEDFATMNRWIYQYDGLDFNLVFRSSRDGLISDNFHTLCGKKEQFNSLVVILTTDGEIFGGYTFGNWGMTGYREDKNAFLFNYKQQKFFKVKDPQKAVYTSKGFLAVFGGGDLVIAENKCHSSFPVSYIGKELELTNGVVDFTVKEMEVFHLTKAESSKL